MKLKTDEVDELLKINKENPKCLQKKATELFVDLKGLFLIYSKKTLFAKKEIVKNSFYLSKDSIKNKNSSEEYMFFVYVTIRKTVVWRMQEDGSTLNPCLKVKFWEDVVVFW